MTHPGNGLIHLMTGKLAALTRLRSLCHFDLQFIGVHQIIGGHTESAGRHLLDRAPPQIAVLITGKPCFVFAPLTGIRLAADPVHGDCQGLVRFSRN